MLPVIILAGVTGAASTAGAWAFTEVTHLHRRVKHLLLRVDALEAVKPQP
jgi:hypothetical protein